MRRNVLDQGLPAAAVEMLRDAGWDAIHVREVAMHEADDSETLAYALTELRVVVTLGRDFSGVS